ncbi:hypothetical protein LPB86_06855 [Pedobacter sp. MC2016-14]|uniref:hypothetical protein n=1 Tax=Pedobacter sp. MC2016-14 TaxID=2897327 RepID=UPI001E3E76BB|nr:hypothetical protein [Pedobacter sp. MC2016-14]MCD0487941.1 hypothetical protein [Pedobacter sp. MC2016-14]
MKIDGKNIGTLRSSELDIKTSTCHISNSKIKILDFDLFESDSEIIIDNCIIEKLLFHSYWPKGGLIFNNNKVLSYVDYQMGGHNEQPIKISNNTFEEFVNFFDCQFEAKVEVCNNIFLKGTNLLGNEGEGFQNSFDNGIITENNKGLINLDGFGD